MNEIICIIFYGVINSGTIKCASAVCFFFFDFAVLCRCIDIYHVFERVDSNIKTFFPHSYG